MKNLDFLEIEISFTVIQKRSNCHGLIVKSTLFPIDYYAEVSFHQKHSMYNI